MGKKEIIVIVEVIRNGGDWEIFWSRVNVIY